MKAHDGMVLAIAVGATGRVAYTAGWDGAIREWSLPELGYMRTLRGHTAMASSLYLTRDGQALISLAYGDAIARVWALVEGRVTATFRRGQCNLCLTPDGRYLVAGSRSPEVDVWELPEVRWVRSLEGARKQPRGITLSRHGSHLASTSYDKITRVWTVSDGRCVFTREGGYHIVGLTPSGGQLLLNRIAGMDVDVWDVVSSGLQTTIPAGPRVVLSPDGLFLVSARGGGSELRLISVPEGLTIAVRKLAAPLDSIHFDQSGRYVVATSEAGATVWRLPAGDLALRVDQVGPRPQTIAFSDDGRHLLLGCHDGRVEVWQLSEGRRVGALAAPDLGTCGGA